MLVSHGNSPKSSVEIVLDNGTRIDVAAIATGNKGKLAEFKSGGLELPSVRSAPERQAEDLEYARMVEKTVEGFLAVSRSISLAKAKAAYELYGQPVLVEDTSLYATALPTQTGPYIKTWVVQNSTPDEGLKDLVFLAEHKCELTAYAISCLAVANAESQAAWPGVVKGYLTKPRGTLGFGWDKIFEPDIDWGHATPRTWGEMTFEEKNELSPFRVKAVQLMLGRK